MRGQLRSLLSSVPAPAVEPSHIGCLADCTADPMAMQPACASHRALRSLHISAAAGCATRSSSRSPGTGC